jgi:hypothetical protein
MSGREGVTRRSKSRNHTREEIVARKIAWRATITASVLLSLSAAAIAAGPPETVHVTYHVQDGKLDEFLAVLKQHYPACLKLGLVLKQPHVILSGKESGGKPVVIEILTWKDGDAPDSVPEHVPEVKKIWDGLERLVEKRDGKPGIEIDEMDLVVPKAAGAKS